MINDAGELITLNGQELYDNIYMYNADGIGYVFGLEQYTSDNIFDYTDIIKKLKTLNLKDKEISQIISKIYDVNKNAVYKKCLEI